MSHVRWCIVLATVLGFAAAAVAEENDDQVSLVFVTCPLDDPDLFSAQVAPFSPEYQVVTVALGTPGEDVRENVLVSDLLSILDQADLRRIVLVAHGWCQRITLKATTHHRDPVISSIVVGLDGATPMQTDPARYEELLRERLAHLLDPPAPSTWTPNPEDVGGIPWVPPPTAEELLVPTVIQPIIAGSASVKRCLVQVSTPLPPEIRVRMNVQPNGHISDVYIEDEQVREAEVGDCVCREIYRTMFMPFEGETTAIVAILEAR